MQKNKHHLIPRSRRKDYKSKKILDTSRTLRMYVDKHEAWHHVFGNMTLDEIILVLHRVRRIKFGEEFVVSKTVYYY